MDGSGLKANDADTLSFLPNHLPRNDRATQGSTGQSALRFMPTSI